MYVAGNNKGTDSNKNDDCITGRGVLTWAKGVEEQRTQAAVLTTISESRQCDKLRLSKKVKEDKARTPVHWTSLQQPCRYCVGIHQP